MRFEIRGVRIFDGERLIERGGVVVEGGRILRVDEDDEMAEHRGATLLPALIDSHVHVYSDAQLRQAAAFGVLTAMDMGTVVPLRAVALKKQSLLADHAELLSPIQAVTSPGGHGTQFGYPTSTVGGPSEVTFFVEACVALGADYIKIIYSPEERRLTTISMETLRAAIDEARRHRKLSLVHCITSHAARAALDCGADGLTHIFADEEPGRSFAREFARRGAFVVPTLSVLQSAVGMRPGEGLLSDPRLSPFIEPTARDHLRRSFLAARDWRYARAETTLRSLRDEGVPILAGTDAPNPGTSHGVSLHGELELLVRAGLEPLEALRAATCVPADRFGLSDRGRIAPGLRADLLLIGGNPVDDIRNTREILGVWKAGVPIQREPFDLTAGHELT